MTAHGFAGNFGGAIESQLPGQVVEEAKDRHEAIEEVTQSSPDIVFSTLRSPFWTDYSLARTSLAGHLEFSVVVDTVYAIPQFEGEVRKCQASAVAPNTRAAYYGPTTVPWKAHADQPLPGVADAYAVTLAVGASEVEPRFKNPGLVVGPVR